MPVAPSSATEGDDGDGEVNEGERKVFKGSLPGSPAWMGKDAADRRLRDKESRGETEVVAAVARSSEL
ncbi:hypothetical protein KC366_g55 [Hortaea werneckii]|nr:hypothetical protein KC366_g55 [Hortaea werneckii]